MTQFEFNLSVQREIRRLIADAERDYVEREYTDPAGQQCIYDDEVFEPISCNIDEELRLDNLHRAKDMNRV